MMVQWSSIGNFLLYMCVSLPLLGVGIYVFMLTTPYKEFRIIAAGAEINDQHKVFAAKAAAYDIGGKIAGLAFVLASAIFHSANLVDLIIWGIIGMVFQVIVYYLFELITPFSVRQEIPKGNISVGIFSAFVSIATGLVMAALIS
jgi:putative membrane protein